MLQIGKNSKKTKRDLGSSGICEGPLAVNMLVYTLPVIASGVLQLLFNAADSIVVGRYADSTALAAVGSTGSLVCLIVNLLVGLSVGASVDIAHAWGAHDDRGISESVHTSLLTAFIGGIAVGIFGFFASRGCLELMSTPADIIDQATLYMKIYFLGLPAMMVYDFSSSILRSTGDTKHPLIFLLAGGVINVVLNLVSVIVFGMGVAGVAIATVVSQIISAVLSIIHLMKVDGPHRFSFSKLKISKNRLKKLLVVGIPAGLQGTVFSISNVVIQSSINSFDSVCVTGSSAGNNIEGFIYIAMNAFYHTALTFVGQHVGAGKTKRLKKVVYLCLAYVTATGVILGLLAFVFKIPLLEIYIPNDPAAVVHGVRRMTVICTTYFLCGLMDTMTGCLRGLGSSVSPAVITMVGACGIRILWIMTVFQMWHTETVLYISYPVSWLLTFAAEFVAYLIVKKKLFKKLSAMPDHR